MNIDGELFAQTQRLTGVDREAKQVSQGLRAPVEGESTHLALLGGSEPQREGLPGAARLKMMWVRTSGITTRRWFEGDLPSRKGLLDHQRYQTR